MWNVQKGDQNGSFIRTLYVVETHIHWKWTVFTFTIHKLYLKAYCGINVQGIHIFTHPGY